MTEREAKMLKRGQKVYLVRRKKTVIATFVRHPYGGNGLNIIVLVDGVERGVPFAKVECEG